MSKVKGIFFGAEEENFLANEEDRSLLHSATTPTSILPESSNAPLLMDKPSFLVVAYIVLIGDTARGILFPTLQAHMSELGGGTLTLSWAVAAFSIGRIIGSPILGHLNALNGPGYTLQLAQLMFVLGTCVYVLGEDSLPFTIIAQCIMGLGTSSLGVCRGYVADRSTPEERTGKLALLTAVQYAGFTVTPLFGALISTIQGEGEREWSLFAFSRMTTPAYILFFLALGGIYMLRHCFTDTRPAKIKRATNLCGKKSKEDTPIHTPTSVDYMENGRPDTKKNCAKSIEMQIQSKKKGGDVPVSTHARDTAVPDVCAQNTSTNDVRASVEGPRSEYFLLVVLLILQVISKGAMSYHETLGTTVGELLGASATTTGYLISAFGACGVVALLCMRYLVKMYPESILVTCGLCAMTISAIMEALSLKMGPGAGTAVYFMSSFVVYSLAYPIGHTAVLGYFSRVVGRTAGDQGLMLSWFGSAGSLSRILFPLLAGVLSSTSGCSVAFIVVSILESCGVILIFRVLLKSHRGTVDT